MIPIFRLPTLVLFLCGLAPAAADVLHLSIGDPARSRTEAPLVLDAITDSRSGELLDPEQLAARLADRRLVLVGESHTDMEFHRAQLRLIEALHDAGREVLIGLEMLPYTHQEHLDAWTGGHYTEEGFLRRSRWYENWGSHWGYYRDIFLFARDQGLPMVAVNIPRETISKVRTEGFEALDEEEAAHVPRDVDTESEEHRTLFRAFFSDDDDTFHAMMSEEMWDGMFRAQCTWDAVMAHNALRALEHRGGPDAVMVVLVGSGHIAYDLGIQRQAARTFDGGMASVIPVPVRDEEDEPIESVQASYADFLWGLPAAYHTLYPSLGISTRSGEGEGQRTLIDVQTGSVGERAGFAVGDVLLSLDGKEIETRGDIARLVAARSWGDTGSATVRRGEETVTLRIDYRRVDPADEEDDENGEEGEGADLEGDTGDGER